MNGELGLCCNAFVQVGGAALDVDFGLLGQVRDRLACEVVLGYGCSVSSGCVGLLTSRLHLESDWFGSHVSMLLRLVRERIVNLVQGWLEAVLSANDNNFGLVGAGGWSLSASDKSPTRSQASLCKNTFQTLFCSAHDTGEATRYWKGRLVNHQWESILHSLLNSTGPPKADVRSFALTTSYCTYSPAVLLPFPYATVIIFTCMCWKAYLA